MKLNKKKFMESEMGGAIEECIKGWDIALCERDTKTSASCADKWDAFQLAIKHFYGVEYFFTRTNEYFGIVTEDESDWLLRVERQI